jgi:uncharacterized membrane protein YkoI
MNFQFPALVLVLALAAGPAMADYKSSARISDIDRTDAQELADMRKVAKLDLSQAKAVATKRFPQARIVEAELDNEDGSVVYEIELHEGSMERTLIVDAGNGSILEESFEPHD